VTGLPISPPLRHQGIVQFAEFSPDSQHVVTACGDGSVRIWDLPRASLPVPAWWPTLAEVLVGQRLDENRSSYPAPEEFATLKAQVLKHPPIPPYTAWAKHLFEP